MTSDAKMFLEIWENFQEFVPVGKQGAAAQQFIHSLMDYGYDDAAMELRGEDHNIDAALDDFLDESEDEEEVDFD